MTHEFRFRVSDKTFSSAWTTISSTTTDAATNTTTTSSFQNLSDQGLSQFSA